MFQSPRFLCKEILLIMAVGLAVRYAVGILLTYPDDVESWALVISNFESGNGLYDLAGYNYTPPWGYLLAPIAAIGEALGVADFGERIPDLLPAEQYDQWIQDSIVPTVAFAIMVKTAFFLCDLVVGYLVYWIVRDRTGDQRKSVIAFALVFLCPFVITAGGAQGMFDTFAVMFTLVAVVMIMRDRTLLAGMTLSVAAMIKMFPAFLVFVFIGYILMKHRGSGDAVRRVVALFVGIAAMAAVVLLPSVLDGNLAACFSFLTARTGTMGGDLPQFVSHVTIAAYAVILLASMFIGLRMCRSEAADHDRVLLSLLLLNVIIIFLYPSNAQYLVLLVPFLAIQMVSVEWRSYKVPYILLAVGVTMFALSRNAVNLFSFAAFTDWLSVDTVLAAVEWFNTPFLLGLTPTYVLHVGGVMMYIAILLLLVTFFVLARRGEAGIEDEPGTFGGPKVLNGLFDRIYSRI